MDTFWKTAFRQKMKTNGVTYQDLALALKMSVPGTKKIFQKPSIGLDRFTQICDILELNASELIKESSNNGVKLKQFSSDADAYLLKEPRAFRLYWLLAVEKLNVPEASSVLGLPKAQAYKLLRQLDRFGLIQWLEDDRIVLPEGRPFVFSRSSKSALKFARDCSHLLVDDAFVEKPRKGTFAANRSVSLPPEKLSDFTRRFNDLVSEMSRDFPPRDRSARGGSGSVSAQVLVVVWPQAVDVRRLSR